MIHYAIKDADTGAYCTYAGRGWGISCYRDPAFGFSTNIERANLYGSKAPATRFINEYHKGYKQRNSEPGLRNLVIVTIESTRKEVQ